MTIGPALIGAPWLLALVFLAVPVAWFGWTRLRSLGAFRRGMITGLRIALVACLALALADLRWLAPDPRKATVFLIDASSSTAGFQAAAAAWTRQALEQMGPDDRAAVIAFAREPVILQPLGQARDFVATNAPPADRTDLAAALRLAQATLPAAGVRRIVVLSDGWENVGRAESELDGLAAAGIQIDVVKPTPPATGVVVRAVETPGHVRDGDPYDIVVQIDSAQPGEARLTVGAGGQEVVAQSVRLRAGTNQFVVPTTARGEGLQRVAARVEPAGQPAAQGDGAVIVRPRGLALLLEDRPGEAAPLAASLERAGIRTEIRRSSTVPTNSGALRDFDAIILANVSATALTLDQQLTLRSYVRDLGRGLVAVGGPNSFTMGDYGANVLGELLPVRSEIPPTPEEGVFGLIIVIDKSGSMDMRSDGVTNMQMARDAAIVAVDLLRDDDIVGVLAFDSESRWIVGPQIVSDNRGVPAIQRRIAGIQADGGTEIFPALVRAFDGARTINARYRHIVLLSDGQSFGGDYDRLLSDMRAANVTLSAIAIGSDADTALMSRLARDGGGRYHFTERIRELPRIMSRETSIAIAATTVQGRVQPQIVAPSAALRGIAPAEIPPLATYNVVTIKDAAETILTSPSGDPLLAQWQYGNGRAVAWTSSVRPDWSGDWATWLQRDRFWGQVARYAMGSPVDPGLGLRAEAQADRVRVTLDAVNDDGSFVTRATVTGLVVAPSGRSLPITLRPVGPGLYEAEFLTPESGAHDIQVTVLEPGQPARRESVAAVTTTAPETRVLGVNDRLLARLTGATGGRQISAPAAAFADGPRLVGARFQPLWQWLIGAALILLVVEIAVRRVRGLRFR